MKTPAENGMLSITSGRFARGTVNLARHCQNTSPAPSCSSARLIGLVLLLTLLFCFPHLSLAQGRQNFTLFGDVKLDELKDEIHKPSTLDVMLYKGGHLIGRQKISNNGRYRFTNLLAGLYEVAIEIENQEVARITKLIAGQYADDVRQDIHLAYRRVIDRPETMGGVISTDASYERNNANQRLFEKSEKEIEQKRYVSAQSMLKSVVTRDPSDYPAWFNLGMLHYIAKDFDEAESCFLQSVKAKPSYFPGLFNLGRVRLAKKDFAGAIEPLAEAVRIKPSSPDANFHLGQAYLRTKQGSKATRYLYEALRLDPIGQAEGHLHLAALYDAAGLKGKAVVEYEAFLKKKPHFSERKKLEQYIAKNKSAAETKKP